MHDVPDFVKKITIPKIWLFGIFAIMTILTIPAYGEPIMKPTSSGTLNVGFITDPATPNPGDQTQIKLNFLNKQTNSLQQHIDYKISVMQGGNQVFGIPVTHTAEGTVSIPFQFQTAGTYQVIIEVEGILFQPIPPETVDFSVDVGSNTAPVIPEFGPLVGMIIVISVVGAVILTKRSRFHI